MHLKIAFFRNEQILNKPFEKTNNRFVRREKGKWKEIHYTLKTQMQPTCLDSVGTTSSRMQS